MKYLYWFIPVVLVILQAAVTFNSLNQMRYEEFIESVQAPFWFDQRQIISGLHVNVGWYAYLLIIYKLFGFSLHTGKMAYLVMSLFSSFVLAYLLKKFFDAKIAALILLTVFLSPTYLYMNSLNLHWAMTFHLLIIIVVLLTFLDFSKKRLSIVIEISIFLLMMITWFFYQAFVFYIPSLVLFYWLKLKQFHGSRIKYGMTAVVAFLLPLIMLFIYVENKQILIFDSQTGSGLFRGGGKFEFSEAVFAQAWTNFLSDFFIRGVSHHYEVARAEFSLIFPVISLLFMVYCLWVIFKQVKASRKLIALALLVIGFDILVFSSTSDLGMPGMKRITPMLFSIYFLWVVAWYYVRKLGVPKVVAMGILSLLTIHHLIVYPINLIHMKDPSPFKVADWDVDEAVKEAQKNDLMLDCRPIVAQLGQCSYDFIYPAVAGSCKWNNLSCHDILGYDTKTGQFIPLSIDLWQSKFFEQ